jgi:hypothetical protein
MRILGGKGGAAIESEGRSQVRDVGGIDQAADNAFPIIGLEAIDFARGARQMFPDRQEKARDEIEFARPGRRDVLCPPSAPMAQI